MNFFSPRSTVALWLAFFAGQSVFAAEIVHQEPAAFLQESLPGCAQKALWLKADAREEIERLLERPYPGIRVRYCASGDRTAWVLDEIGKTEPITSGIVVGDGRVERLRVLVFRESRGGEVHREAFTRQFDDAALNDKNRLDRNIDGITGATLSVRAVDRQARLALLLDRIVKEKANDD